MRMRPTMTACRTRPLLLRADLLQTTPTCSVPVSRGCRSTLQSKSQETGPTATTGALPPAAPIPLIPVNTRAVAIDPRAVIACVTVAVDTRPIPTSPVAVPPVYLRHTSLGGFGHWEAQTRRHGISSRAQSGSSHRCKDGSNHQSTHAQLLSTRRFLVARSGDIPSVRASSYSNSGASGSSYSLENQN
jgi:hypothetical protein